MRRRVRVSVPGKLILMGEHAAVYGRPALVVAVGPRARVELAAGDAGVVFELPDLDRRWSTDWTEIATIAENARAAWSRYAESPTPERFRQLETDEPEKLVAIALGEVAHDLGTADLAPLVVRVGSSLPIGSGFGSSAATAVALVGSMLAFCEIEADRRRIDRIALEVERRQHGFPSGVDHKTVIEGGVVWARRRSDGELRLQSLGDRAERLESLLVFHTGRPEESTGQVVAAVRRLRKCEPEAFERRLVIMEDYVEKLRAYLTGPDSSLEELNRLIRGYQRCLEELGVVPEPVRRAVQAVAEQGGAAKISGAGASRGAEAGCLLVNLEPEAAQRLPELRPFRRQPIELGVEGFKIEEIE